MLPSNNDRRPIVAFATEDQLRGYPWVVIAYDEASRAVARTVIP
jgi:hypothetical protein